MVDKMETQKAEFDAAAALTKAYRDITMTPIVDDDYPEVRHRYEGALHRFLRAVNENRPDLPAPWKSDTGLRAADTRSYSEIEASIAERSKKFKNDFGSQWEHRRYMALALAGEVGEMCNLIKKEWREGRLDGKALLDEYSDIFVYWLLGCHTHGWTLRRVVEHADAKAERKINQVLAERAAR